MTKIEETLKRIYEKSFPFGKRTIGIVYNPDEDNFKCVFSTQYASDSTIECDTMQEAAEYMEEHLDSVIEEFNNMGL